MKRLMIIVLIVALSIPDKTGAQAQEAVQLALNIQKLSQLRKILQNMYDGYKILTNGYNKVRDIAQGNFSIHEIFLDGLMKVNPAIKQYSRVGDIIAYQVKIVKEYKEAMQYFKRSDLFSAEEIDYIARVYGRLFDKSIDNLDALFMVITASQLRMSDDERLQTIDKIYEDISDQLSFLRYFNNETKMIGFNRAIEKKETIDMKSIYAN
ncbi:MAG: TerB family tellurite resistance protein [Agriterribacter sp.]